MWVVSWAVKVDVVSHAAGQPATEHQTVDSSTVVRRLSSVVYLYRGPWSVARRFSSYQLFMITIFGMCVIVYPARPVVGHMADHYT